MLRDPRVNFAGYKHPHPLENDIVVKVQTVSGTKITPTEAVKEAAARLRDEFQDLRTAFAAHVAESKREEQQIGAATQY